MLRRSLPSHGGIVTAGSAEPTGVESGVGVALGEAPRLSPGSWVTSPLPEASGPSEASALQTSS